ncbi:MAG: WG repeat-containing protein [Bacilli bacterium]|nr:WG repeat-containing protein [Bacilli bacterium]
MERRDFVKLKLESEINPLNNYEDISYAFDSLYLVKSRKNNLYGLINTYFEEIIPCEYQKNEFLSLIKKKQQLKNTKLKDLNISKQDGMTGYVDKTGKLVIPRNYQKGYAFSENLACVKEDGVFGFIDKTGVYQILPIYEGANSFSFGLAPVKKDSKWGYINKYGEEIISFIYDSATPFYSNYALVSLDGKYYFIDTTGVKLTTKMTEETYFELTKSLEEQLPISTRIIDYLKYLSVFTLHDKEIIIEDTDHQEYINKVLNLEQILLEDSLIVNDKKMILKK